MPRGGAHFSSSELDEVLGHYDIGTISKTTPLSAGDRRAPKKVIETDRGKFLLKRRPKGKDDSYHVAFAHTIQTYLGSKGFAIAPLVATSKQEYTALYLDNHAYELFCFVEGGRFNSWATPSRSF